MELLDVLNEYRNGNKKIFDILFTNDIETNELGECVQGKLIMCDNELYYIVAKIYHYYSLPYKFGKKKNGKEKNKDDKNPFKNEPPPKFYEQVYNGTFHDLMGDGALVLYTLFQDKNFVPLTSAEIYQEFYWRLLQKASENIRISSYGISENIDYDGEEHFEKISLFDLIPAKSDKSKMSYKYRGVFQEIADVISNYDIKLFLRSDAIIQKNIVDLIKKYYKPVYNPTLDMNTYPRQKDMLCYYKYEFGETISQPEFSTAIEGILKAICECTVSLKGKPIKRSDFIKERRNTEINDIQEF